MIEDLLDAEEYMDEPLGPIFVRLAWHSSGTYCRHTKTGGSDGATMSFAPECNWGANAGLGKARRILQEEVKRKCKGESMSNADLWVFAGVVAIEQVGIPETFLRK